MGIDGFHKWLNVEYGSIYYNIWKTKKVFHNVYIDLNYLLHLCHYNSNDEKHLINKMSQTILELCGNICPLVSVNLFCDGTAPFAKMVLQRERRNKNVKMNDDVFKTSLNFTPGTKFIEELPEKLEKCINIIKKYHNVEVNIDSVMPGEAEIKIKNKLIENYKINKLHSNLLITNDADVVLILAADESYVTTHIMFNNTVIPIYALLKMHFEKYSFGEINNLDFVLLNLFLGNDYVPKIGFVSPYTLWDSYSMNIYKHKYLVRKNEGEHGDTYDLNKNCLIDIFNDCIGKIGIKKLIKNNKIYDSGVYMNYFDGILWTLKMYNRGECTNYDYICKTSHPIDILNLVIYLVNFDICTFKNTLSGPISSTLCGILLLPENAQQLIDIKYYKFIRSDILRQIYCDNFQISIDFIKMIQKEFDKYNSEFM